ncbi:MAG: hypothetical protein E7487_01090 [Ruminococcaceae bacterium]|nr:hypothetical protein [Oscillospiraceae bacterium]
MKIEKIDKNFIKENYTETEDRCCYEIPCCGFDLYGVFYDKKRGRFMRMDGDVADQVSEGVSYLATNTSGGRIRFSTDSSVIGISVAYSSLVEMSHMPLTGSCGFALLEKIGTTYKTVSLFRPLHSEKQGYTGEVLINDHKRHEYILYFPLYNDVTKLQIYLDKTATLFEPEKYRNIKPILYYGASIDQGGCASRPDSSYTAILSKWNDIDFINLGFSGNAKGEPLMAEYASKIDCSLFFIAYDGNAPSAKFLEETHFKFYETYRKIKKDIPIVFMSVPCFENFPEAAERREILKRSCLRAKEQGDNNIYFIDGEGLFDDKDREMCTVEGIHPNDLGFYRIATHIYQLYNNIDEHSCH